MTKGHWQEFIFCRFTLNIQLLFHWICNFLIKTSTSTCWLKACEVTFEDLSPFSLLTPWWHQLERWTKWIYSLKLQTLCVGSQSSTYIIASNTTFSNSTFGLESHATSQPSSQETILLTVWQRQHCWYYSRDNSLLHQSALQLAMQTVYFLFIGVNPGFTVSVFEWYINC